MGRVRLTALVASLAMSLGTSTATAQRRQAVPPLVITSLSGQDLFQFYCASCHGREGRGDGPAAASLKNQPTDLTTIAARRGGDFPSEELERFVAGEEQPAPAHGSREMPVWGPVFRNLEPHDTFTRVRLSNLVAYLRSIQAKK